MDRITNTKKYMHKKVSVLTLILSVILSINAFGAFPVKAPTIAAHNSSSIDAQKVMMTNMINSSSSSQSSGTSMVGRHRGTSDYYANYMRKSKKHSMCAVTIVGLSLIGAGLLGYAIGSYDASAHPGEFAGLGEFLIGSFLIVIGVPLMLGGLVHDSLAHSRANNEKWSVITPKKQIGIAYNF